MFPKMFVQKIGRLGILSCLLLLFLAIGCSSTSKQESSQVNPNQPNIVLILVDTVRTSNMSAYGYQRRTTPFIESMLKDSVLFERVRSQASCTFPSVNSLLTSRYSSVFNNQKNGHMGISDEYPTIAEVLQKNGYKTIAVSSSPIVRATPSEHNPFGGFGAGFDVFDESCIWKTAACMSRKVFNLLESVQQPFFLYLHYMDPHDDYNPIGEWNRRWAKGFDGAEFIQKGNPNPIAKMLYNNGPKVPSGRREMAYLQDLYDEEIAFFDFQLKRFFNRIEKLGLLENTLFVLCSDHGEEFMEHNHIKHCRGLWDTLTRTPLIFRFPSVQGGQRITTPVENLDIVPTLLDYAGISALNYGFEGDSLRPILQGQSPEEQFTYSNQSGLYSVDNGRFKLILNAVDSSYVMYDLLLDPREQVDIFDRNNPESQLLGQRLRKWLEQTEGSRLDEALENALKKQKELRDLGYLQ